MSQQELLRQLDAIMLRIHHATHPSCVRTLRS